MRERASFSLSFLDLLSCALGGAIVLMVIASVIKYQTPKPVVKEFILVECAHDTGTISFVIQPPAAKQVVLGPELDTSQFDALVPAAAKAFRTWLGCEGGQRYTYLEILAPIPGDWRLRPLFQDYTGQPTTAAQTRVQIWTKNRLAASEQSDNASPTLDGTTYMGSVYVVPIMP